MAPTFSVHSSWRVFLRDMGLVPARVLRRAGLPADLLSRGTVRVAPADWYALWRAVVAESASESEGGTGGQSFALRFAQALSVEAFDPALFAAVCCPDLATAAARIAVYKPLIGPLKLHIDEDPDDGSLTLRPSWPASLAPPPALGHLELLFWVALVRLCTRAVVRPTRYCAPVPPDDPAGFRAYLGAVPQPGPVWAVTFSQVDAARPFLTANEGLWSFFEPELRRRLQDLEDTATTAERVRAALLERLPAGGAAVETIGRELGMSKRTLQRRLRAEGTSFQALLASTRESLARHYLRQSQLTAAEIGFLLGYDDPNSFYRAFHAWTGTTPESLRAAAG
jgi:AraC-like DNA-binding protein